MSNNSDRRQFLKYSLAAAAGATAAVSFEEQNLLAKQAEKEVTGVSKKVFSWGSLKDLKGKVPTGKIGNLEISKIILGGNLIGGWAHARDLIYVSKLVQAYHTDDKVWETYALAEECGINTHLTNPKLIRVITEYWKRGLGKIQFISDCGGGEIMTGIKRSIDSGACACYVHGAIADGLARNEKWDTFSAALDLIRQNGLPAGIGAHRLHTIQGCADRGIIPDYWMKTLHPTDYWSARHPEEHGNIFCRKPAETIAFMEQRKEPWIAFKTMAAGAVHPKRAFPYAFEGGADFLCLGMYDFQIVEDVNLARDILSGNIKRIRPWCG